MQTTLNCWKEIASFLHRGVRTVQRWEHEQGLPVHRVGKGTKAPVVAFSTELQDWLRCRKVKNPLQLDLPSSDERVHVDKEALERQRELRVTMRTLLGVQRQWITAIRQTVLRTQANSHSQLRPKALAAKTGR